MNESPNDLITVKEIARIFNVAVGTAYEWTVPSNTVGHPRPVAHRGRTQFFAKSQVLDWARDTGRYSDALGVLVKRGGSEKGKGALGTVTHDPSTFVLIKADSNFTRAAVLRVSTFDVAEPNGETGPVHGWVTQWAPDSRLSKFEQFDTAEAASAVAEIYGGVPHTYTAGRQTIEQGAPSYYLEVGNERSLQHELKRTSTAELDTCNYPAQRQSGCRNESKFPV